MLVSLVATVTMIDCLVDLFALGIIDGVPYDPEWQSITSGEGWAHLLIFILGGIMASNSLTKWTIDGIEHAMEWVIEAFHLK